jgi:hypothetical protein
MRLIGFSSLFLSALLMQVPEPSSSDTMPAKYVADAAEQWLL